jgi:hypothetical protein
MDFNSSRAQCCKCGRKVVPKSHSDYKKRRFLSLDMNRPGEESICVNREKYERTMGVPRPQELEVLRVLHHAER